MSFDKLSLALSSLHKNYRLSLSIFNFFLLESNEYIKCFL